MWVCLGRCSPWQQLYIYISPVSLFGCWLPNAYQWCIVYIYICQIAWCENLNVIIKSSSMRWLLRAVLLHISSPWPACSLTTSSISMLIALWEMSSIEAMCPFRCTSATPDSFAVWVWRLPCVNAVNGESRRRGRSIAMRFNQPKILEILGIIGSMNIVQSYRIYD